MIGACIEWARREGFGRSITDPPDNPGKSGTTRPATGFHDARDSVREAAVRGQGTRTDRAYRRGLRGRGQR